MLTPAIRAIVACLALPLLVARVLADHQDRPIAADDLALFAHRLYGSSNLHCSGLVSNTGLLRRPRSWTPGNHRPTGPTGKDSRGSASGRAWFGSDGWALGGIDHRACGAVEPGARLRRAGDRLHIAACGDIPPRGHPSDFDTPPKHEQLGSCRRDQGSQALSSLPPPGPPTLR